MQSFRHTSHMKVFTVSELTLQIKQILEPQFQRLRIRGEISNLKQQSSGHLYFSLKDAGSQISSVLFRSSAGSLARMPKEGDQVIAQGELSLYTPRGQYQMIVRDLEFLGKGELLLQLHQLKEKLQNRGWFAPDKKKAIPKFPKKIGVVTSPTGAVIQDILNVLSRRFSGFHVILNPVKVQGEGAAEEIAQAIDAMNQHNLVDLMIIGRGGGSIEDLWAFNEEIVAKAIYESKIPIISAVGHETDVTIADFVADIRAPTPSAAAEIATSEKINVLKYIQQCQDRLQHRLIHQIQQSREKLHALKRHPLLSSPYTILSQPFQRFDDLRAQLDIAISRSLTQQRDRCKALQQRLEILKPSARIALLKERFNTYPKRFLLLLQSQLAARKEKLTTLSKHFHAMHPKNLLKKGYSILQLKDGSIAFSASDLSPKQPFTVLLHDGRVDAMTIETKSHDPTSSFL